jgi:hypothetical protein
MASTTNIICSTLPSLSLPTFPFIPSRHHLWAHRVDRPLRGVERGLSTPAGDAERLHDVHLDTEKKPVFISLHDHVVSLSGHIDCLLQLFILTEMQWQLAFQKAPTQPESSMSLTLEEIERACPRMSVAKKEVPRIICRHDGTVPRYRQKQKLLMLIRGASVKCE